MENFLKTYLAEGLNSSLKDNELAKRLFSIVNSGEISSMTSEQVWNVISSAKEENYVPEQTSTEAAFRDLRFRHLALQNVKKYPGKESSDFYGLSFCIDGSPVNSVFLGANGIGKSTLFGALEFVGMRKLNSAALRGYKKVIGGVSANAKVEKTQTDFLTHASSSKDDIRIFLETNTELFSIEGISLHTVLHPLVCEAFYCSDYDVRMLETCPDYSHFLLSQLGLENYRVCLMHLYYAMNRVEEARKELNTIKADSPSDAYVCEVNSKIAVTLGVIRKPTKMLSEKNLNAIGQLFEAIESEALGQRDNLENLIDLLRRESRLFSGQNHLTECVRKLYENANRELSDFRMQLDNKNNPDVMVELPGSLRRFRDVRNKIVAVVRDVNRKLNGDSDDSPDLLSANYLKEYEALIIENDNLRKRLDKIPVILQSSDGYSSIVSQLKNLISWLEDKLEAKLKEWLPKIEKAITSLLQEYFDVDNDVIEVKYEFSKYAGKSSLPFPEKQTSNDNFLNFEIKILSSAGCLGINAKRYPQDPREYLNTFKYKLFCVALKLVFCCVAKDLYHVNFPLIIDDVFDASDFDNRIRLKEFVMNLFQNHDSLMDKFKTGNEDYGLQFIFFTQDDLIADQVEKGLRACHINSKNVKFGHIFDYHEIISESGDKPAYAPDEKQKLKLKEDGSARIEFYPLDDVVTFDNKPLD